MHEANLLKLADYLESLPPRYRHFDMAVHLDHRGSCNAFDGETAERAFVANPNAALNNCGTVACAVGHGPAAGIPLDPAEFKLIPGNCWNFHTPDAAIDWIAYADRVFTADDDWLWDWMFGGDWENVDNTHYGAAARIRYALANGGPPDDFEYVARPKFKKVYAPFHKRNRA